MNNELTIRDLENLEYRKNRLADLARRAELLLSGRRASLLPIIRKRRVHNEEGTQALIRDLLKELDLYLRFRKAGQSDSISNTPLEDLEPDLTDEERQLFESFLYCALRLCEGEYDWIHQGTGTFDDLLELAKQFHYTSAETLYIDELIYLPEGFWGELDYLYSSLTRTDPASLITQEEKDAMAEEYKRALERYNAYIAEMEAIQDDDPEELQAIWEAMQAAMTEEERAAEEELDRMNDAIAAARESAMAKFADKETFLFHYMRLRKVAFLPEAHVTMLAKWLEYTIDIYLFRQGKSNFLSDENYFPAHRLLEKAAKDLQGLFSGEG